MKAIPYAVSINEQNGSRQFTTQQLLEYQCFFESAVPLIPMLGIYDIEAYEFSFYHRALSNNETHSFDRRIGATIAQLISEFFTNPHRVLIYSCDYSDGRGYTRQALFARWFQLYSPDGILRKQFDIQQAVGNTSYILQGCILYRDDFPETEALQTFLIDRVEDIATAKYSGQ